jgi:hypothetical protein
LWGNVEFGLKGSYDGVKDGFYFDKKKAIVDVYNDDAIRFGE